MKRLEEIILDTIMNGVWVANAEDTIFYVNKGLEKISGLREKQLVGSRILLDFPEETMKYFLPYYLKAKKILQPVKYEEIPVVTPAGRRSYQSGWLLPLVKEDRTFDGMICTVEDVTERVVALQKLKILNEELEQRVEERTRKLSESESKYRELFNNMRSGVAVYEAKEEGNDFIFTDFNIAAGKTERIKREEIIGKNVLEVFPGVREFGLFDVFQRVWKTGNPEHHPISKYEDKRIVGWRDNYVYKLPTGEIVAVYDDVTTEKVAEQKLKVSKEKYRNAFNLVKFYQDLFAHDMTNILQALLSIADFYAMVKDSPKNLEEMGNVDELIREQAKRGVELISMVWKLSRLDESGLELRPMRVVQDLQDAMDNIIDVFKEREIKFNVIGLDREMMVLGSELLFDTFDNLLSNAIKFSPNEQEAKVDIILSRILQDQVPYLKIEFQDHGIGIPEDKKEYLFERSVANDASKKGIGLGLLLVKKIVDNFGGKIWVENRVEGDYTRGSNFIVMLREV